MYVLILVFQSIFFTFTPSHEYPHLSYVNLCWLGIERERESEGYTKKLSSLYPGAIYLFMLPKEVKVDSAFL